MTPLGIKVTSTCPSESSSRHLEAHSSIRTSFTQVILVNLKVVGRGNADPDLVKKSPILQLPDPAHDPLIAAAYIFCHLQNDLPRICGCYAVF